MEDIIYFQIFVRECDVTCEPNSFCCSAQSYADFKQQPCETVPAALILLRGCNKPIRDGQVNDVLVGFGNGKT